MKVEVRYFASVREALGAGRAGRRRCRRPASASLRDALAARGGRYAEALGRAARAAQRAQPRSLCREPSRSARATRSASSLRSRAAEMARARLDPGRGLRRRRRDRGAARRRRRRRRGRRLRRHRARPQRRRRRRPSMELEHYPGMTEAAIEAMIDAAFARFDIRGARVVHRVGMLAAMEQIVLVAVTSAHRGQAFQACEFLMDYLKTQAPFWKKEASASGRPLGRRPRRRRRGAGALGHRRRTTLRRAPRCAAEAELATVTSTLTRPQRPGRRRRRHRSAACCAGWRASGSTPAGAAFLSARCSSTASAACSSASRCSGSSARPTRRCACWS